MTSPSPVSLPNAVRQFAIELHQLAYTMPNGHEHELLKLSQRMITRANEETRRQAGGLDSGELVNIAT